MDCLIPSVRSDCNQLRIADGPTDRDYHGLIACRNSGDLYIELHQTDKIGCQTRIKDRRVRAANFYRSGCDSLGQIGANGNRGVLWGNPGFCVFKSTIQKTLCPKRPFWPVICRGRVWQTNTHHRPLPHFPARNLPR